MKRILTTILTLTSLAISMIVPTQLNVQAEILRTENAAVNPQVSQDYGKIPMLFEQNKGQTDTNAKFISRGKGYTLYLTETQAVFQLREKEVQSPKSKVQSQNTTSNNLRMNFVNANANPTISGTDEAVIGTAFRTRKKGKSKKAKGKSSGVFLNFCLFSKSFAVY